ncbi:glycosyltransferase family 25 protein [Mangrovicoccus algicola]|uniref:Glycosyltransferase family 25 protein n=1 Tax=Mangrovicoccus algicola TaxID=2771008 RepID=A0A8J7CL99_9RHOB|nr:glycosyltransferase family 25 protein [Mangrovicoccus algicola]MBE3639691.1 glycosyltransferase family 25 protein [Mangrovicoccus algicola]
MGKVFTQVINLDDSTDRMSHAAGQMAAAGLDFSRCPGIDGRGRSWARFLPLYIPPLNYLWFGRHLTGGELGCYMSHLRAARAFLKSGARYGLVFEDDCVLQPEFRETLHSLVDALEAGACPGWRLINLGKLPHKPEIHTAPMRPLAGVAEQHLLRCYDFPLTLHGVMWSRRGALDFLLRGWLVMGTVDNWLRSDLAIFGGGYCLSVPIVRQRQRESVICSEPGADEIRQATGRKQGWWKTRSQVRARNRRLWGMRRRRRQGL